MPTYRLIHQNYIEALAMVEEAHRLALEEHPTWPISVYAGDDIITEEMGEAAKAAIDAKWKGHPLAHMLIEHSQAAAMHIRQLQHLLNVEGE